MPRTFEFNDVPAGYLITFRGHGTWLHGDKRGSVDRFHNRYGTPRIPFNRYLWTEEDLNAAIAYVEYDQGEPLP